MPTINEPEYITRSEVTFTHLSPARAKGLMDLVATNSIALAGLGQQLAHLTRAYALRYAAVALWAGVAIDRDRYFTPHHHPYASPPRRVQDDIPEERVV